MNIEHEYIKDEARSRVDSYAIRNDMDTALLEWLILGIYIFVFILIHSRI